MSLMQLLAAGHSFVGINDAPSRYKLQENWLPRFGPVGPAVGVASGEEVRVKTRDYGLGRVGAGSPVPPPEPPAVVPTLGAASAPVEQGSLFARTEPGVRQDAGRVMPAIAVLPPVTRGADSSVAEPRARRAKRSGWWRPGWLPFKQRGQPASRPVPLGLERVRVVRNDLSDADLEIVPSASQVCSTAGSSTTVCAAPGGGGNHFQCEKPGIELRNPAGGGALRRRRAEPRSGPTGFAARLGWGGLATRLFHAGRGLF